MKSLILFLGSVFVFAPGAFAQQESASLDPKADYGALSYEEAKAAVDLSVESANIEAARLALFSTMLILETGEVVEVSEDIRKKYRLQLKAAVAPIPIAIGGGITYALWHSSAGDLLAPFFKAIGESIEGSYRSSAEILNLQSLNVSFEKLEQIWVPIWARLEPSLGSIFRGEVSALLGGSAVSASVAYSSYMTLRSPKQILEWERARKLIGYDSEVDRKLDDLVRTLSDVYAFEDEDDEAKLKEALRIAFIEKALENNFERDADYELNILRIMEDTDVISLAQYNAAKRISEILEASKAGKRTDPLTTNQLGPQLRAIAEAGALIEQYVVNESLPSDLDTQARAMLYSLDTTFEHVRTNFED